MALTKPARRLTRLAASLCVGLGLVVAFGRSDFDFIRVTLGLITAIAGAWALITSVASAGGETP